MTDNFINSKQTKEQRRNKRRFLRDAGITPKLADRMQDWTHSHIVQYIQANNITLKASYEEK